MGAALLLVTLWCADVIAAEPADSPAAAAKPPSEAACASACQRLIDRCAGVFGPAMGDMRPFCTKAVMRRCLAAGVEVCEAVGEEGR
jgi:hypothetical protein